MVRIDPAGLAYPTHSSGRAVEMTVGFSRAPSSCWVFLDPSSPKVRPTGPLARVKAFRSNAHRALHHHSTCKANCHDRSTVHPFILSRSVQFMPYATGGVGAGRPILRDSSLLLLLHCCCYEAQVSGVYHAGHLLLPLGTRGRAPALSALNRNWGWHDLGWGSRWSVDRSFESI